MARKKSGGFGKVLEFIGLVDDEEPRDAYGDEYESDNYGRQQAYVPQRAQRMQERPRQEMVSRRSSSSGYEPTRAPRMSRTQSSSYDDRYDSSRSSSRTSARRTNAFVERVDDDRAGRYDYSPRTPARSSRFGSYDDGAAARSEETPRVSAPRQSRSAGARQRTVMFSLHSLEDCCDVIDNLILNNTVVLTLDDLEPRMMQRAVDTLSGAVFALHATIRKASDRTYLVAPMTVEVNETYDVDRGF